MLVGACLLALATVGCGRGEGRAGAEQPTITVLFPAEGGTFGTPESIQSIGRLVFLRLVDFDENGELEPRLARSWEHSPDYREWTFHLRSDVRWHDGVPVTAHDYKFSMELTRHPAMVQRLAFQSIWDVESITALDDSTVTITYTKPTDALDDVPYLVLPKHLVKDLDPERFLDWEFWTHPVGNGPYRYVSRLPQTMVELEANPDYYRGVPKIERVVFKYGVGSQVSELLSGNVDVVTYFDRAQIHALASDPRFRVYHRMYWDWLSEAIYWNQRHPLFRDPRVRRALTLAIDRRELTQLLRMPEETPLFDVIFSRRVFQRGMLPEPLPYDPERAAELLDAAGWRNRAGGRVRERAGVEARFTAIYRARDQYSEKAVIYVQDQLQRVGVRMEVHPLESSSVVRERLQSGEFEAAFCRVENDPALLLDRWKWFGEGSPIGYNNPAVVKLLEAAVLTIDPEARDQIDRELMEIFQADLPMTFLFPGMNASVAHRRLRGLSSPYRTEPGMFMEHLWIEEEP